jgi:hypothetical protein
MGPDGDAVLVFLSAWSGTDDLGQLTHGWLEFPEDLGVGCCFMRLRAMSRTWCIGAVCFRARDAVERDLPVSGVRY